MGHTSTAEKSNNVNENNDFHIVAINIGIPRRPPTQKREKDQDLYPGLVEVILNSSDYSSNILYETSGGKLGYSASDKAEIVSHCSSISYSLSYTDMMAVVHKFRGGFCDALMDLQSFHFFWDYLPPEKGDADTISMKHASLRGEPGQSLIERICDWDLSIGSSRESGLLGVIPSQNIEIISDAMNTEQPSQVMDKLFIGEALSVRNVHTLQNLCITHIICLYLDEIGQSDS
ncbi:Dual specificity protein phosphatase PHS1 [Platanthera guangdongensis]|uniref:Dual specificity protein phosphatase PHS1 n=1 Tax=Platanthera guangdongensis TaxID=2320717 RepID=A0ABR2LY22_9ASPA